MFRSSQEWAAAWASAGTSYLDGSGQPWKPPVPVVDFNKNMVVGVSAGDGPSSCSGVGIKSPTEQATSITFTYVVVKDGGRQACAAVIVPLVAFVEVSRSDKTVLFNRVDQ